MILNSRRFSEVSVSKLFGLLNKKEFFKLILNKMIFENLQQQQGDGILTRDPNINPPPVRKILSQIGNEKIESLQLVRTPLSKISRFLLNIASFGQLESKLKETNIDDLFHLSLFINGKYVLEKNEVIKLTRNPNEVKDNSQTLVVPVSSTLTINELIENTQKQMKDRYGPYNAVDNNCSIFLSNVLSANGLMTDNAETFLNQKTIELFEKFPSISSKIVKFATDVAASVDKAIYGEGQISGGLKGDDRPQLHNFGLHRCKLKF